MSFLLCLRCQNTHNTIIHWNVLTPALCFPEQIVYIKHLVEEHLSICLSMPKLFFFFFIKGTKGERGDFGTKGTTGELVRVTWCESLRLRRPCGRVVRELIHVPLPLQMELFLGRPQFNSSAALGLHSEEVGHARNWIMGVWLFGSLQRRPETR